jgi:hypothetical protein
MGERHSICHINSTLLFLFESYVRWVLIETYAKSFQFSFDDSLVRERFVDVEDDEYQVTSARNCNYLATTSLKVRIYMEICVIPCRPLLLR